MILTPLQKFPKNVEDLGKLIVAKGLKKLPKVRKIAQSGHTVGNYLSPFSIRGFRIREKAIYLIPFQPAPTFDKSCKMEPNRLIP